MKDFRNLRVWEKAHKLCIEVYEITASFPTEESAGLTAKIRQVASHIPVSIARGCGYNSQKEYMKYVQYAANATSEFEYLIVLATDLNYLLPSDQELLSEKMLEVRRMLFALVASIRNKIREGNNGNSGNRNYNNNYNKRESNDEQYSNSPEPGNSLEEDFRSDLV